jgi:hypothetical protein
VLKRVGIAPSRWYRPSRDESPCKRPGPLRKRVSDEVEQAVVTMATDNPWYGYKRIAVMCCRAGGAVKDREAYAVMRNHQLLQRPPRCVTELHQAARLFELLPQQPNDLWQMDVTSTHLHIPADGMR